jgi:organic hydroperoxide reductase OsmC/OhrA
MPTPISHRYDAMLTWNGSGPPAIGSEGPSTLTPPRPDGEATGSSAEHLLLASLNLCLQATFEVIARRSGLAVTSYSSHATAIQAQIHKGFGSTFTFLTLEVAIGATAGDHELVRHALGAAMQHCIVASALNAPVRMSLTLRPADVPVWAH